MSRARRAELVIDVICAAIMAVCFVAAIVIVLNRWFAL